MLELTPSVNLLWLALLAATEGRRSGISAVAGIALGLSLLALAATLGGAIVLDRWPWLIPLLQGAGIAYFLWLAYDAWPRGRDGAPAELAGSLASFRRGLIVNLVNAKSAIFFLTVLPGFIHADAPPRPQLFALAASYVAIATGVHTLIVALAAPAYRLLVDSRRNRLIRRIASLMLLGLAAMMVLRAL